MADWVTISSLATAGGTLVLAVATFASVRSANQAARVAERSLLAGLRPVLVPSRFEDPAEKVGFMDGRWFKVSGGGAVAEVADDAVYLAIALRNVGNGLAVLDRWDLILDVVPGATDHRPIETYRRLTRDIYVPAGDHGFWQGAFRDRGDPMFDAVARAVKDGQALTVDLFYGDHEGGQHTITRFRLSPSHREGGGWLPSVSRHWNVDRGDPR